MKLPTRACVYIQWFPFSFIQRIFFYFCFFSFEPQRIHKATKQESLPRHRKPTQQTSCRRIDWSVDSVSVDCERCCQWYNRAYLWRACVEDNHAFDNRIRQQITSGFFLSENDDSDRDGERKQNCVISFSFAKDVKSVIRRWRECDNVNRTGIAFNFSSFIHFFVVVFEIYFCSSPSRSGSFFLSQIVFDHNQAISCFSFLFAFDSLSLIDVVDIAAIVDSSAKRVSRRFWFNLTLIAVELFQLIASLATDCWTVLGRLKCIFASLEDLLLSSASLFLRLFIVLYIVHSKRASIETWANIFVIFVIVGRGKLCKMIVCFVNYRLSVASFHSDCL